MKRAEFDVDESWRVETWLSECQDREKVIRTGGSSRFELRVVEVWRSANSEVCNQSIIRVMNRVVTSRLPQLNSRSKNSKKTSVWKSPNQTKPRTKVKKLKISIIRSELSKDRTLNTASQSGDHVIEYGEFE